MRCGNDSSDAPANGDSIDDLLRDCPSLEPEDILACLDRAATLAEQQITPLADVPSIP